MCRLSGVQSGLTERRFATVTGRYNNQDEIGEHITRWTLEREPYEIATLLQAHSVAAGPVIFNEDAFSDPQYEGPRLLRTRHPRGLRDTPAPRNHVESLGPPQRDSYTALPTR